MSCMRTLARISLGVVYGLTLLGGRPGIPLAENASVPERPKQVRALTVGTPAPDAPVRDLEGETLRLKAVIDGRRVALVFYRGGW